MKKKNRSAAEAERYTPSHNRGLSGEQVARRVRDGYTNRIKNTNTKSVLRILIDNTCTFFNLIWTVLIGILLALGEYNQLFFVLVVAANTLIAIFFELRAKFTLEKLSLVTAPRIKTVRDGERMMLSSDELVLDDVILLAAGAQIPADCILLEGAVEMNESLLTGESDPIKKGVGDTLLAGSFIISGGCRAQVDKVGADSYIQTIATQVKAFKAPQSYLFRDIHRIIHCIGIFIIPFAVIMFLNNYFNSYTGEPNLHEALVATVASVAGMIPAGMFLLITIAFSLGVVKLSMKKTQVKDSYSIEMLARTDTLCLDKTGTITDGTMRVVEEIPLDGGEADIGNLIANVMAAQSSSNFTSDALNRCYAVSEPYTVTHNIPFSSKRKYTATAFQGIGTLAVGAPEFLSVGEIPDTLTERINAYAADGKRVLMLAASPVETDEDALPEDMKPIALIVLEDHIREEAPATIAWFAENGVAVKIISGDNPVTVSAIARRVGVVGAEDFVSLEGLSPEEATELADKYTVFGRVTPEQKLSLVRRLRALGHVVAMTGDGVNDTMALKEADCSIAMADGSDVARGLANIVLLDNNFASLPAVVREGRQVVNNVQRSSVLFLMKTFFTIALSLTCICLTIAYPFDPNSLFIFEVFVTGLPSVLLALLPNSNPIEGRFISQVLRKCVPDGLVLYCNVLLGMLICYLGGFSATEGTTLLTVALTFSGFVNLIFICLPLNRIRLACLALSALGITLTMLIAGPVFGISDFSLRVGATALGLMLLAALLRTLFIRLYEIAFFRKSKKTAK